MRIHIPIVPGLTALALLCLATNAARPAELEPSTSAATAPPASQTVRPVPARSVSRQAATALPVVARPPVLPQAQLLVVLVDFPGTPAGRLGGAHPLRSFTARFFGRNPQSLRGYYAENSYGKFMISGQVVGGKAADQAGAWLELPHSLAYYAGTGHGMSATGTNDVSLCEDVVNRLDAANFNWRPFQNGQGQIPYFIIVPDVPDGAATGAPGGLWSTEWPDVTVPVADVNATGTVISFAVEAAIGVNQGQLVPLGTVAHEFGHLLGLPDLYDTSGVAAGLGNWSLMGTGAWSGPQEDATRPSDLDAFSKWFLGWTRAILVDRAASIQLPAAEHAPVVTLVYPAGAVSGPEYFLIENRDGSSLPEDGSLPGRGLLVYRVDAAVMQPNSRYWLDDTVNAMLRAHGAPPVPGVEIVQADGSWSLIRATGRDGSAGDPFPGSSHRHELVPGGNPAPFTLSGRPAALWITDISQSGPTMSFHVAFLSSARKVSVRHGR